MAYPDTWSCAADGMLVVSAELGVLANDYDVDGDALSVSEYDATSEAGGTVVIAPDGALTYQPPVGFVGNDQLEYTMTDGVGTSTTWVLVLVSP